LFYPDEAIRAGQPADDLQVAAADGRYELDDWRIRRDGSRFIANVIYTALVDGDGTLRGYAVVLRDITERKLSERTRAWLSSMVEHTMTAIIGLTPPGIIESWNPAAEHLFGFTAAEAIGQSITLLTPDDRWKNKKRSSSGCARAKRKRWKRLAREGWSSVGRDPDSVRRLSMQGKISSAFPPA